MIDAKIIRYKVNRSYKRCVLIGNGSPRKVTLIHVGKNFKLEHAKEFVESLRNAFI